MIPRGMRRRSPARGIPRVAARRVAACCVLLALSAGAHACRSRPPAPSPRIPGVRLLLVVVIDQAGSDILDRARPLLHDGLRRLLDQGARFENAFHEHAVTTTCPGHATLVTGVHPSHSGIVDNEWFDTLENRTIYCVEDPHFGLSPAHLLASGIGDWVKRRDSRAKVIAVGGKDRATIPMAGKTGDGAYWYNPHDGTFIGSPYYDHLDPAWLHHFNDPPFPDTFFGAAWEPLPVDPSVSTARAFVQLDQGVFRDRFPHALGRPEIAPDSSFYEGFAASPFLDHATEQLAERAITGEDLGADDALDLLAVSFSALDSIGHAYGPNSLEALDTLLRLDTTLGDLLRFAEQRTGPTGLLVALSADHGVMPLPEYLVATGQPAAREGPDDQACFRREWERVENELGHDRWLRANGVLDRKTLERNGVSETVVLESIRNAIEECPTVARVRTRDDLRARGTAADSETRLFRNSFHPERSPDFYIQRRPFVLWTPGRGTSHGSAYEYDRKVPIVLLGPGIAPHAIREPVATVDFAPTLAVLLGLPVEDRVDGVDRSALVLP